MRHPRSVCRKGRNKEKKEEEEEKKKSPPYKEHILTLQTAG